MRIPSTSRHLVASFFLLLSLASAHAAAASAAQHISSARTYAIKRYMMSSARFADIEAELAKRNIVFARAPQAPAMGATTRASGTQAGFARHLVFEGTGGRYHAYTEWRRPQHPLAPLPYATQEVVFDTPDPEVSPVGTLSFPRRGGPFPAVVLVAGSGAHDRDAGMSLHKTLLVLADHLTRQGFAVLRYDKRGVGLTGGAAHPGSTTDDYAADALAALRFLHMQPNVDPARVGILGHSEGAIVAAMVAAQAPAEVRFAVMLGGPGLPGAENQSLQDAAARRAAGMAEPLVLLNQAQERELLDIAASARDRQGALAAMRAATQALPQATKTTLEIPAEGLPDAAFEPLLSPWMRRYLALDPGSHLEKVKSPVLALVGEKDLQVPAVPNLKALAGALARGSAQADVRQLPGLNHNLQTARSGQASEYHLIEETVAPSALTLISNWMRGALR